MCTEIKITINMSQDYNEAKKTLVVNTIAEKASSAIPSIHRVLVESNGECRLVATILSGGITNCCYKVSVYTQPNICVFAKLSFEFPQWNPDAHHGLQRTENEYKIQKIMHEKAPDCVVAPIACWDVEHNGQEAKLFVTEWSKADKLFGHQFTYGSVDPRIAPKLAETLAALHNIKGFDPEFNEQVQSVQSGVLHVLKKTIRDVCQKERPKDRTEAYCHEVGAEVLMKVLQANIDNLDRKDCLIHGDVHVFNILVEATPSIEALEQFGPDGLLTLCDWEMAHVGPIGKDIGGAI